jgi:hypothetical protein
MIEVFGGTMEKLDSLTDDEFAEIGFYIADDDAFSEGDHESAVDSTNL